MSSYSPRTLESTLSLEASEFPLILIEGMPCVGKTTLAKHFFSTLPYIDLSDIQARSIAMSQPEAFFSLHGKRLLIDSVEQAPELFKHLPSFEKDTKIVLVGNLPQEIKEDLKNNCNLRVYQLSPFSQREINGLGSEPFNPFSLRRLDTVFYLALTQAKVHVAFMTYGSQGFLKKRFRVL